jgi:ATP-dependent Zn protease
MRYVLPSPVTTSPSIEHHISVKERSNNRICKVMFPVRLAPNLRYDVFLDAVNNNKIESICLTENQISGTVNMYDGNSENIIFPNNYDIVNFILENDIPIEIRESHDKLSMIDIIGIIIQISVIRIISRVFQNENTESLLFKILNLTSNLNSELHNIVDLIYNLSNTDINDMMRVLTCKLYVKKRRLRALFAKK